MLRPGMQAARWDMSTAAGPTFGAAVIAVTRGEFDGWGLSRKWLMGAHGFNHLGNRRAGHLRILLV